MKETVEENIIRTNKGETKEVWTIGECKRCKRDHQVLVSNNLCMRCDAVLFGR